MFSNFNGVRGMVFNATFNNISVIFWQSVLSMEETEYPEKTTDMPQVTVRFVTPYVMDFLVFNDLR
jgi:hypothetical protein